MRCDNGFGEHHRDPQLGHVLEKFGFVSAVDPVDGVGKDDNIDAPGGSFLFDERFGKFTGKLPMLLRDASLPGVPEEQVYVYELVGPIDHGQDLIEDLLVDDPFLPVIVPGGAVDEKTDIACIGINCFTGNMRRRGWRNGRIEKIGQEQHNGRDGERRGRGNDDIFFVDGRHFHEDSLTFAGLFCQS